MPAETWGWVGEVRALECPCPELAPPPRRTWLTLHPLSAEVLSAASAAVVAGVATAGVATAGVAVGVVAAMRARRSGRP